MRKLFLGLLSAVVSASMSAEPLTVCDFENYEVGTTWTMWNRYGGGEASTATVVADPMDPNNKVLHVAVKNWNSHAELAVTGELAGRALTDRYPTLRCQLYRSNGDNADYKQFAVFLGTEELYRDDGYPYQGDKGVWQTRNYAPFSA